MVIDRPFRFGVQLAAASSAADWTAQIQHADALGYNIVLIPDHLGLLAYGPAIGMAAGINSRLRFGTLVVQNPLRHPALLAMEAATLDLLTDGRFELGLGVGGSELGDYTASGIAFAPAAIRVKQLEESVQVIKALLGSEPVNFHSQHYTITNLDGQPKPVQQPMPLLTRDHFETMEFNTLVQRFVVTDDPDAAAHTISERWGVSPAEVLDSPYTLIGTIEQIIARIQERRRRFGLSYYVVFDHQMDAFAPIAHGLSGR